MQSDAEFIFEYIQNEYKPKLFGLHGTSLGGLVAAHVGYSKKVDFLCVDRTFASLSEVVRFSFGGVCRVLFNILTDWNVDISNSYFNSSAYKVLIYDSKDEIIHILSSLFHGNVKQMILKKNNFISTKLQSNNLEKIQKNNFLKKLICFLSPFFQKFHDYREFIKEEKLIKNYFNTFFFSEKQMTNITQILKRLLSVFFEVMQHRKTSTNHPPKTIEDYLNLLAENSSNNNNGSSNNSNLEMNNSNEGSKKDSFSFEMYVGNFNLDEDIGKNYFQPFQDKDCSNETLHDFVMEVSFIF